MRKAYAVMACGLMLASAALAEDAEPVIDGKPLSSLIKQLRSENRGLQLRAAQSLMKATSNEMARIVEAIGLIDPGNKNAAANVLSNLEKVIAQSANNRGLVDAYFETLKRFEPGLLKDGVDSTIATVMGEETSDGERTNG